MMSGRVNRKWQAVLRLHPGTLGFGQAFITSSLGFSFEELLYFKLILKEWKIVIGISPRKDRLKSDLIPVAPTSEFLFQQQEL